jgi:hypothetical protein
MKLGVEVLCTGMIKEGQRDQGRTGQSQPQHEGLTESSVGDVRSQSQHLLSNALLHPAASAQFLPNLSQGQRLEVSSTEKLTLGDETH